METFDVRLERLRSLEMLANREMKIPDFSFAQICSNDRIPSQDSASPFMEETEYIGYPNGSVNALL